MASANIQPPIQPLKSQQDVWLQTAIVDNGHTWSETEESDPVVAEQSCTFPPKARLLVDGSSGMHASIQWYCFVV